MSIASEIKRINNEVTYQSATISEIEDALGVDSSGLLTTGTPLEYNTARLRALSGAARAIGDTYMSKADPTANSSGTLSSPGYYYAHAFIGGSCYSFGLFYWDGSATLYVQGAKGYSLLINNFGIIFLYDGNSTIPQHTLYTAKF